MSSSLQMAEISFANAAALAANGVTAVKCVNTGGFRRLRLRVLSDKATSVAAAVWDAPMAALTDGVMLTATAVTATTSGKGKFVDIDVGGYSQVAIAVTNSGALAGDVVAAGKFYDPAV